MSLVLDYNAGFPYAVSLSFLHTKLCHELSPHVLQVLQTMVVKHLLHQAEVDRLGGD